MKFVSFFFCFSLLTLFSSNLQAQMEDPAIQVVQDAVNQFFGKNMEAYAAHFAPQGELVNPMGFLMTGPQEIITAHQQYLKMLEGINTHAAVNKASVRYIRPDVATVLLSVESWHSKEEGEKTDPSPYRVTVTLSQYDGAWLIDQFQVTPIIPLPTQG